MKASEESTIYHRENIYFMMLGLLQGISREFERPCIDFGTFFSGIERRNFVAVIAGVQEETGLDLEVCGYLKDNVENHMRKKYLEEEVDKTEPRCTITEDLVTCNLYCCTLPLRNKCSYRNKLHEDSNQKE
jgi:hypothetical protein